MKRTLFIFLTAILFVAAAPIKPFIENNAQTTQTVLSVKPIVKEFYKPNVLASNGHTYNVTVDFNLSTGDFGVVTCHDVLTPWIELTCNINSGLGFAISGGTQCFVDEALSLTIQNTSIALTVPVGTYTFL